MMRNRKKLILSLLVMVAVGWIIRDILRVKSRGEKQFDLFYQSDVQGMIESVRTAYKSTTFTLTGMNTEFVFSPYTDKQLNDGKIFLEFAKKGDSVFKPAYSDTLILVKQGKKYFYTFQKIDN